jgi:hypothetical protein
MSDSSHMHTPTPEFTRHLARDISRAFRHDARFAPSARSERTRQFRMIAASVVGTIGMLAVGLVVGTTTGYASARVESDRQRDEMHASTMGVATQLAVLRLDLARARSALSQRAEESAAAPASLLFAAVEELRSMEASAERIELDLTQNQIEAARPPSAAPSVPVKSALAITCSALERVSPTLAEPQAIPTRTLAPPSARSTLALWSVNGVRELPNGNVLVIDGVGRELRLFDASLSTSIVTIDSTTFGRSRPLGTVSLLRYLGDSSLLPDLQARSVRVIDGTGHVARTISFPLAPVNTTQPMYTDAKGRLLFVTAPQWGRGASGADSAAIVRADLSSGVIDTVARIRSTDLGGSYYYSANRDTSSVVRFAPSGMSRTPIVPARDDWAALADGSIALIRGHDYHIDWVRPDGSMISTPRLPFDWQQLAQESKRQLDSATRAASDANRRRVGAGAAMTDTLLSDLVFAARRIQLKVLDLQFFSLEYENTTAFPDPDGNVWILPGATQPAAARVYDVVNSKGELFQRVRVPAGQLIAGFGKSGAIYLVSGDRRDGFYIERTVLSPR